MKVLFFMTHAGYARNFEWTLRMLAERGHSVHVALDQKDKGNLADHDRLLRSLASAYSTITVGFTPDRPKTDWNAVGVSLRTWLDFLRYLEPEFANAPKLHERARRRLPNAVATVSELKVARSRLGGAALRATIELAHDGVPVREAVRRFVEEHEPDVVVLTPLVELGSPQTEYLRCASALGVPTAVPVASWDNLTVKGLVHDVPRVLSVWNERQVSELRELHRVRDARIAVTGAVPYDHWFGRRPARARDDFCRRAGLDAGRRYVLYVGSSPFIAPNECDFVVGWSKALRAVRHPELGGLQILVRPHPQNRLRGSRAGRAELARLADLAIFPCGGANPVDEESRADYFDSVYHSAAVVGVNTSAFVESAIIGRPVHTLLAPEYADTQRGTLHFRHLLVENGGMLRVAASPEEHAEQLAASLRAGGDATADNLRFVRSFVRPLGLDRPATPVLVDELEALAAGRRPPAAPPTRVLRRALGRPLAVSGRWYLGRRFGAVDTATLRRHVEKLAASGRPVIAGPFTGEVGFELLYWIPMLRWAVAEHPGLARRLVIASRGGTEQWYGGLGAEYVDLFDTVGPDEFRASCGGRKQREPSQLELDFYETVAARLGLEAPIHLHPGTLYRSYYRNIRIDDRAFVKAVERGTGELRGLAARYRPFPPPAAGPLERVLPDEFVAVRFYFGPSFEETAQNAELATRVIAGLAARTNVVLLNNGLELDDHVDLDVADDRVVRLDGLIEPANNLRLQTIAVSRASAFVGTYGGLGYLGPHFGVPSFCFVSTPTPPHERHLELAQAVFRGPGWGPLTVLAPDSSGWPDLLFEGRLRRRSAGPDGA